MFAVNKLALSNTDGVRSNRLAETLVASAIHEIQQSLEQKTKITFFLKWQIFANARAFTIFVTFVKSKFLLKIQKNESLIPYS